MELSKPGEIHKFCRANGILTFAEYLEDFASVKLKTKGYEVINHYLDKIEDKTLAKVTKQYLQKIKEGQRDVYF